MCTAGPARDATRRVGGARARCRAADAVPPHRVEPLPVGAAAGIRGVRPRVRAGGFEARMIGRARIAALTAKGRRQPDATDGVDAAARSRGDAQSGRVDGLADGRDDAIQGHLELGAGHGDRTAAAGPVPCW